MTSSMSYLQYRTTRNSYSRFQESFGFKEKIIPRHCWMEGLGDELVAVEKKVEVVEGRIGWMEKVGGIDPYTTYIVVFQRKVGIFLKGSFFFFC